MHHKKFYFLQVIFFYITLCAIKIFDFRTLAQQSYARKADFLNLLKYQFSFSLTQITITSIFPYTLFYIIFKIIITGGGGGGGGRLVALKILIFFFVYCIRTVCLI